MSRKQGNYKPRAVLGTPWGMTSPAPKAKVDRVMLRFLTALDAMARGEHPGKAEWRDLSDAINTIETLALRRRKLNAAEAMPLVNAGIAAMVGAARRFSAGQSMRLDAAGLQAMRDVLDVYRQCLEGLSEFEMATAQAETQRRMHQLLRSKKPSREVIAL